MSADRPAKKKMSFRTALILFLTSFVVLWASNVLTKLIAEVNSSEIVSNLVGLIPLLALAWIPTTLVFLVRANRRNVIAKSQNLANPNLVDLPPMSVKKALLLFLLGFVITLSPVAIAAVTTFLSGGGNMFSEAEGGGGYLWFLMFTIPVGSAYGIVTLILLIKAISRNSASKNKS